MEQWQRDWLATVQGTDSDLFVPLFREALYLPCNMLGYNFERPTNWDVAVASVRACFAHYNITVAHPQVRFTANGYMPPVQQQYFIDLLAASHWHVLIDQLALFKLQIRLWLLPDGSPRPTNCLPVIVGYV